MSTLPNIEPPDNFERTTHMRATLGSLPTVAPPSDFEDRVLRAVHRPGLRGRNVLAMGVVLVGVAVLVWFGVVGTEPNPAPQPAPVPAAPHTISAPVQGADSTDKMDTAATGTKPKAKQSAKKRRPLHGVAGY